MLPSPVAHAPADDGPALRRALLAMRLLRDKVPSFDVYPFNIRAVRGLRDLPLEARVMSLVEIRDMAKCHSTGESSALLPSKE